MFIQVPTQCCNSPILSFKVVLLSPPFCGKVGINLCFADPKLSNHVCPTLMKWAAERQPQKPTSTSVLLLSPHSHVLLRMRRRSIKGINGTRILISINTKTKMKWAAKRQPQKPTSTSVLSPHVLLTMMKRGINDKGKKWTQTF